MPPRKPGEPLKPDTIVAMADVQVASALDEKNPPSNREQLLDGARTKYQQALQAEQDQGVGHDPRRQERLVNEKDAETTERQRGDYQIDQGENRDGAVGHEGQDQTLQRQQEEAVEEQIECKEGDFEAERRD